MADSVYDIFQRYAPDEKGFTALFNEYYSRLCFFACRIINNKNVSEDIVQDCFTRLWQRRENIDWKTSIVPYIYGMVRFSAYHYLRDRKITYDLDNEKSMPGEEDMLQHLIETETLHEIYQAIQTLPPKCKDIFKALFMEDKNVQEVSGALNINESTVRSHKAAALALLRRQIELVLFGMFFFM